MTPTVGSIWRDNYDAGTGRFRHVKVLRVGRESAFIQRCNPDGSPVPRSPERETSITRFNGGKSGFTHVADPLPREGVHD